MHATATMPLVGRPPEAARLVDPNDLLRAIARIQRTGFPATTTALAAEFGVTPQTISYHVGKLQDQKFVTRRARQPGVKITPAGRKHLTTLE